MGLLIHRSLFSFIAFFALNTALISQEIPPSISAPIALVADAATGMILMEKNSEMPVSPASLAKIMTLYLTAEMDSDALLEIPPQGAARFMRPNSSVIGLETGDRVSVGTLRRAAAVASAGDAAWTLAIHHSGEVLDFVDAMNRQAVSLGMNNTTYSDPDGWSSVSKTTGQDQMRLAIAYIREHEQELLSLHAPPYMVYGENDELTNTPKVRNTNLLIGEYDGIDGLKTGTIPSAGFHFIATAKRGDTRFIAVVMGILDVDYGRSIKRRAEEARLLLDWAFTNYRTWYPSLAGLEMPVPVRHGSAETVLIKPQTQSTPMTLLRHENQQIVLMTDVASRITAPVSKDEKLGTLRWYDGSRLLLETPLTAEADIRRRWRLVDALGLR